MPRRRIAALLLALALLLGGVCSSAPIQAASRSLTTRPAQPASRLLADCGGSVGTHCWPWEGECL